MTGHRSVLSVLLGYCLIQAIWSLSWKTKPTSTSAPVGGNATFHCEINNRVNRTVIWHDSHYNIFFQNSDRFNAPDRYIIQGQFNLVITNIVKDDNKQFICNVKDLGIEAANLTVLLPPDPPTIVANATGRPYRENQVIALTCSSTGGNPNPTISWKKNGQFLSDNIVNSPAQSVGGVSSSQLIITLDRTDHEANYTCIVFNEVNAQHPLGTFQVLQVQYSPHITFAPYNPLNILLGRNAQIQCVVDANPQVFAVVWKKDGQPLLGTSPDRVFNPSVKSDSGVYTCTANNNVNGPREGSLTIEVLYPPIITVPRTFTAAESERVNITCNIDANPEPYEIHWERLGESGHSIVRDSKFLVFNSIRVTDVGNYTCKAWSHLKESGEDSINIMQQEYTYIYVKHPPGSALIQPIDDYNIGERVELKCSASPQGYPAATFEWKKNNILLSETRDTLVIQSARLSDNGDYTCTPVNTQGRGQHSQVTLTINEPPTLSKAPDSDEIHVPLEDQSVLDIRCEARGRPSPTIKWFKDNDNEVITTIYSNYYTIQMSNETVDEYSFKITSRLYFRGPGRNTTMSGRTHLRVDDIGNYTCRVSSPTHPNAASGKARVFVQFKPLIASGQKQVAVDASGTAALPCVTQANPSPSFIWYRNNMQITEGGRFSTTLEKLDQKAQYQSLLSIQTVGQEDLGSYTCIIRNALGNATKPLKLSFKSEPEPPRNLELVSKTWDSVALQWTAGFDGGMPQEFYIRYSAGADVRSIKVHPSDHTFFNVTKLTPQTSYLFFVFGRNVLGNGKDSGGIPVQTDELIIPSLSTTPAFDASSGVLVIKDRLDPVYCLKVDVKTTQTGTRWETIHPCLELIADNIEILDSGVTAMNVSVCLKYRIDVCGSPVSAPISSPSSPGLTERDVIIIACVCAVIIVTLLIVLIGFICRRKRNQDKDYERENAARRPQPVNGSLNSPQKSPQSYENADGPLELQRNGNGHIPNHGVHQRTHDTSYDSQLEKQMFENEMNRRNENNKGDMYSKGGRPGDLHFHGVPHSPSKEKYNLDLEEKKDGSLQSGQESGYSTPDPNKPKKVIYEVVV